MCIRSRVRNTCYAVSRSIGKHSPVRIQFQRVLPALIYPRGRDIPLHAPRRIAWVRKSYYRYCNPSSMDRITNNKHRWILELVRSFCVCPQVKAVESHAHESQPRAVPAIPYSECRSWLCTHFIDPWDRGCLEGARAMT